MTLSETIMESRAYSAASIPSNKRPSSYSAVMLTLCSLVCAAGQDFVPFVIPARISPEQPVWVANCKPIKTDSPRLSAAEHFYDDNGAVRIWGVNVCFG